MIFHKLKTVFVHIPKTGGQSIEHYFYVLNGNSKEDLLLEKNHNPEKGPYQLSHLRAHEYAECGHLSQNQYQSYFSFAFVRNPWTRLVSEYLHKKLDNKYSFKQFIFDAFPEQDDYSDAYRHVIPQTDYLINADGEMIVDFVGRFENLQQDFEVVCKRLDLEDTQLPHRNSTSSLRRTIERKLRHLFVGRDRVKRDYRDYYDQETVDRIAQLYSSDIKMFGYEFDS